MSRRPQPPGHDALSFDAWPAADRAALDRASAGGSPFSRTGRAARWRPATRHGLVGAYGRWLGFLVGRGCELSNEGAPERITPERMETYARFLIARCAPVTVATCLGRLHIFAKCVWPERDWRWLREMEVQQQRMADPVRNKAARIVPQTELLRLGCTIMAKAEALPLADDQRAGPRHPALLFRDGLMIALLAMRPLRQANFLGLQLHRHLVREDAGWTLAIPAAETKNRRSLSFPFLQDLAAKTRRGIAGRVQAGKCFGPPPYGYRRVTGVLRADGELERGLRAIDPGQAAIVQRIFAEYAAGRTPNAICRQLNAEDVPSPSGKGWGPMSLRGRPTRDDGILRNRAYIGELVWNRRTRIVDPGTGRALRRLNPTEARVTGEAPGLRIIDQPTWDAVQRRLAETATAPDPETGQPRFWEKRAPEYLLSGKVRCGACRGTFAMMSGGFLRCTTAQRHLCDNRASIRRERLEAQVLAILAEHLMEPVLAEAFAEAFTAEWNRLAAEAGAQGEQVRRDLASAERRLGNLIDAIADGMRTPSVQTRLAELEAERDRLALALQRSKPSPVRLMPNLGASYRRTLAGLRDRLSGSGHDPEAMALARQLIERVVIQPTPPRKPPRFTVEGHLAKMLTTAQPGLPQHAADSIARAARLSDKEGPGAHWPLAGGVRGGQRPPPGTPSNTARLTLPAAAR